MKYRLTSFILLFFILMTLPGCALLEDVFAAGVWVGVIALLIVAGLIFFIVRAVKG
ncbi:MAG: hypothetical protein WEC12_00620 [Balneolaceae bacterium]